MFILPLYRYDTLNRAFLPVGEATRALNLATWPVRLGSVGVGDYLLSLRHSPSVALSLEGGVLGREGRRRSPAFCTAGYEGSLSIRHIVGAGSGLGQGVGGGWVEGVGFVTVGVS